MTSIQNIAKEYLQKQTQNLKAPKKDLQMVLTDKATLSKMSIQIYHINGDIPKFRDLLRQLLILKNLNHFNIANVKRGLLIQNVLFLEKAHLDYNLKTVLVERGSGLSDDHIKYIFYQLVLSVACLHSQEVEHLGLSPECVLLTNHCDVKLSGFQDATPRFLPKPSEAESVYQDYYMAPELILNNSQNAHCPFKADIWALGCIFFELLERKHVLGYKRPYLDQLKWIFRLLGSPSDTRWILNNEARKWATGLREQPKRMASTYLGPKRSCAKARDLLDQMLRLNPFERADIISVLRHPYFSDIFHEHDIVFGKSRLNSADFAPCHPNNQDFDSMKNALSKMSMF